MDETIPPISTEQPAVADTESAPLVPTEPLPPIDSRFLFVDVAALRAKQLKRGARPRLAEDVQQVPHKAERVAMEEVRRGLVYYDVPPPPPVDPNAVGGGSPAA